MRIAMSLLALPNELLLAIASDLESQRDVNALTQVSHRSYYVVSSHLYSRNISQSHSTGLIWASKRGELRTVQRFLDEGADFLTTGWPTDPRHIMMPPLQIAAREENGKLAQLLLRHDATSYSNVDCREAMEYACRHNHIDVAKAFMNLVYDPVRLHDGGIPFLLAAADFHQDGTLLKLLLNHGFGNLTDIDVNTLDVFLRLKLIGAACRGNTRSLDILLDRGFDVNIVTEYSLTALSAAIFGGQFAAVKLLLE